MVGGQLCKVYDSPLFCQVDEWLLHDKGCQQDRPESVVNVWINTAFPVVLKFLLMDRQSMAVISKSMDMCPGPAQQVDTLLSKTLSADIQNGAATPQLAGPAKSMSEIHGSYSQNTAGLQSLASVCKVDG